MTYNQNPVFAANMVAYYQRLIVETDAMIAWYCEHYFEYGAYPNRVQIMCETMISYRANLARYQQIANGIKIY